MEFKNRKREIKELNDILNKKSFQFIIIYGRRRVGKTELILHTTKSQNRLYYLAVGENNLERFYRMCESRFDDISKLKMDYEVLFQELKDKVDVIILDEFQNMISEDTKIVNLFQAIIDTQLQKSKLKLLFIGSSVSMIVSNILTHSSPLYGRRTGSIKLKAIDFFDLRNYFSDINLQELVEIYGFADGIPYYLNEITPPFWSWLSAELNRTSTIFKDEVDFLMKYEFTKPSTYKLILEAVSQGKTKINEIKDFINLRRTDISPYLKTLIDVDMVFREVPITENVASRHGRYYLKDNFLRFWFRFIYPNLSALEEGTFNIELIKQEYSSYLGKVFEDIVKNIIIRAKLIKFTKIGRWWWKDNEIDLVALDDPSNTITFIECKWQEQVNAKKIVSRLIEKTTHVRWKLENRNEVFAVFAKSFSKTINIINDFPVICFSLEDLDEIVNR
ncbi:MAG: ATP-binding protein [Promethearchaeota archaeon]